MKRENSRTTDLNSSILSPQNEFKLLAKDNLAEINHSTTGSSHRSSSFSEYLIDFDVKGNTHALLRYK